MPQRIDVPGMGVVEFPDGMSDAQIASAIKANMPAPKEVAPQVEDPGALMAGVIAAGRTADKVVKGVQQAYYGTRSALAPKKVSDIVTGGNEWDRKLAQMASDEANNDQIYAGLKEQHPVATGVGEVAPFVALPMGAPAAGLKGVVTAGSSAAIPALLSYGSAEERLKRASVDALGGITGVAAGKLVGRLFKPSGQATAQASSEAMDAASRIGYKPTPGEVTQNAAQLGFENYLARSPGSASRMKAVKDANQAALNTAAARAMGETSNNLSEGVFAAAKNRIGQEFNRVDSAASPDLGNDFLNALGKIDAGNAARGPFKSKAVDDLVNKAIDLAQQGKVSGEAYRQIRSELSNRAQGAFSAGDATLGQAYKQVRDQLDAAAKASLSGADAAAKQAAEKQYAAFKTLSKGNVAEGGNVSPARVASVLRQGGNPLRTGSASGELADIARIGEAFKGVPNPTSGQLVQQMLFGNPITALPSAAVNKLLAEAYMSKPGQAYVTNGLINLSPAARSLVNRSGGLLGVNTTRGLLGVE